MKKRIFSKNDRLLDYKDVYSLKNGTEILKTIQCEDAMARIDQFKNYQQRSVLTHAYYPFLDNSMITISDVQNIIEANDSYVCDLKKDVRPIHGCEECRQECRQEYKCKCDVSPCARPLSSKGQLLTKKKVIPCSNPSSVLYLCKWNNTPCIQPENPFRHCHCTKPKPSCDCHCKCSLCKNAKPLFI
jgi:hypothetical protein